MMAQVYFDNEPIIRLFIAGDDEAVGDLRLDDNTPKEADVSLHRVGLYRRERWRKTEWGLEARVYQLTRRR